MWAPLVVATARGLMETYGRTLVVPMTLVHGENFRTIREGFAGIAPTFPFVLTASRETIGGRLVQRGDAPRSWPHAQIERCVSALEAAEFGIRLDAERSVAELAERVLASVEGGW